MQDIPGSNRVANEHALGPSERLSLNRVDWPEYLFHFQRYAFARQFAKGRRVLDCACGEGYGAAILADSAQFVTGVDNSTSALDVCTGLYLGIPNIRFVQGDVTSLPFASKSFDLITCFETIEHVTAEEQVQMLAELARVLVDDGIVLISTPVAASEVALRNKNPLHKHELTRDELAELVGSHFPITRCYQQQLNMVSILREDAAKDASKDVGDTTSSSMLEFQQFQIIDDKLKLDIDYVHEPAYQLIVASRSELHTCPGQFIAEARRRPAYALWNQITSLRKQLERTQQQLVEDHQGKSLTVGKEVPPGTRDHELIAANLAAKHEAELQDLRQRQMAELNPLTALGDQKSSSGSSGDDSAAQVERLLEERLHPLIDLIEAELVSLKSLAGAKLDNKIGHESDNRDAEAKYIDQLRIVTEHNKKFAEYLLKNSSTMGVEQALPNAELERLRALEEFAACRVGRVAQSYIDMRLALRRLWSNLG